MYAVIKTGGKQYRVAAGDKLRVEKLPGNVGDMVTPFSSAADSKGAVVAMADMSTLEVEADVSEASLSKIRVGQSCEITLDALPDSRFRGMVSRIVPTVDRELPNALTITVIERAPVKTMVRRSMPTPSPAVGGSP